MSVIYETVLRGAGMWSKVVSRGKTLRFTDLKGGANVSLLLFNALERSERYNMPDTLKGQQIFFLTEGACLHSDMGRVLASVTEDSTGWHDTVCGVSDQQDITSRYGERSYQDARNECYKNGRECFLIELAKWGLDERSLVPNVNLFSKVLPDQQGELTFEQTSGADIAGRSVSLRLDMDCLVVLNTCQHPLNPSEEYLSLPVRMEVIKGDVRVAADDSCRMSHPENERAFLNTEDYHNLRF